MRLSRFLCALALCGAVAGPAPAQTPQSQSSQTFRSLIDYDYSTLGKGNVAIGLAKSRKLARCVVQDTGSKKESREAITKYFAQDDARRSGSGGIPVVRLFWVICARHLGGPTAPSNGIFDGLLAEAALPPALPVLPALPLRSDYRSSWLAQTPVGSAIEVKAMCFAERFPKQSVDFLRTQGGGSSERMKYASIEAELKSCDLSSAPDRWTFRLALAKTYYYRLAKERPELLARLRASDFGFTRMENRDA